MFLFKYKLPDLFLYIEAKNQNPENISSLKRIPVKTRTSTSLVTLYYIL